MIGDSATIEDLREVNIFYLDHDPVFAARAHCDRHVVKMILETAQLLSSAWHVLNPEAVETDIDSTDPAFPRADVERAKAAGLPFDTKYYLRGTNQRIYAPTHLNHPCAEWVRSSGGAYAWAWRLGMALLDEYTFRYKRAHATAPILRTLEAWPHAVPREPHAEPPCAMPEAHWVYDGDCLDAELSYRAYYRDGKRHLLQYTRRAPPAWLRGAAVRKSAAE